MIAALFLLIEAVFLILLRLKVKKKQLSSTEFKRNELTIVIPFRNEKLNFKNHLSGFTALLRKYDNIHVFWVNDHSTDGGEVYIQTLIKNELNQHTLCSLPVESQGKKYAHRYVSSLIKTPFVALTDADCIYSDDWLGLLSSFNFSGIDALILPVKINPVSKWGVFQVVDYNLMQSVNYCIENMASAANMVLRTSGYKCWVQETSFFETVSGDDHYFLKRLKEEKKNVCYNWDKKYTVQTSGKETLRELLQQQIRWFSKLLHKTERQHLILPVLVFLMELTRLWSVFSLVSNLEYGLIICFHVLTLFWFNFKTFSLFSQKKWMFWIPFLYYFIYPFYHLFLLIASFRISVNWKGRKLSN